MIRSNKINSFQSARITEYLIVFIFLSSLFPLHFFASQDVYPTSSHAASEHQTDDTNPWYKNIDAEWGGHLKLRGFVSWIPEETIFEPVVTGSYYDGNAE
jgi:hypothetical protein